MKGGRLLLSALLTVGVLIAGGCDGSEQRQGRFALRIEVEAEGGRPHVWRLHCQPTGGSWPHADAACARLRPADLAPIGPETRDLVPVAPLDVRISGVAFGRSVRLKFDRLGSSTRRNRFQRLSHALHMQPLLRSLAAAAAQSG